MKNPEDNKRNLILEKNLGEINEGLKALTAKEQSGATLLNLLMSVLKGEKGDKPIKGVDYFNEEDIKQMAAEMSEHVVLKDKDLGDIAKRVADIYRKSKKGLGYYNNFEKQEIIKEAIKASEKATQAQIKANKALPTRSMKVLITKMVGEAKEKAKDLSKFIIGNGVRTITVSKTAPEKPAEGDLWIDIS